MFKKSLVFLLFIGMTVISTSSFAAETCDTLLIQCDQCHDRKRICENLGNSGKFWKSIMKFMVSNGADISEEEGTILSKCLASKAEAAKKFCK